MPPRQKAKAKTSAKANPAAAVSTPPPPGEDIVPHQPPVEPELALALLSQDGRLHQPLVSDGEDDDGNDNASGWKRKVRRGDRPKSLLVTWSHTSNPTYKKPSSLTRKQFARALEYAADHLDAPAESIAVFQEKHKNGQIHYHALVALSRKSQRAWQMDDIMYETMRGKTYTEAARGESHKPQNRILRYLMVPTAAKPDVDPSPYFTRGVEVPPNLRDEAQKALVKLQSRPASQDEVR